MDSTKRFRLIDELFREALRLDEGERASFLDERCAGDDSIKSEVLSLLAEDAAPTGALDRPALGGVVPRSAMDAARPVSASMPERIGRYRVVRRLGRGGMGVVYEAQQDSPRRTVALKVINPGIASGPAARRLAHEAHLLGRLQHPGIAQVFEAGVFESEAGEQPYFAMELIRGVTLDRYVRSRGLSTEERLRLMARVCDAVQHAHQRGVIHRDLKPGNVLVDESGAPKVLDFGVARATNSDVQVTTLHTHVGQLLGTVPYMSPEQAGGNPDEIDTRSDVYALGVMLFEMLSDRMPFDVRNLMLHEAVRVIRETEPSSLSASDKSLAGDVETIVRKALEKEKDRRYQTASEMAEDIRRFLRNEPIAARPPSTLYQLRKFARRNRPLVGAVAAVMVALAAGVVATSVQAVRATKARDEAIAARAEAERQRDILASVNAFITQDLLTAADPWREGDANVSLLAAIDQAAGRIEERFAGAPEAEGLVRETIGETYSALTKHAEAEPHLRRALELARRSGADPETLVQRLNTLARQRVNMDDLNEAATLLEEAWGLVEEHGVADDELVLWTMMQRASIVYWNGDLEGAEARYTQAVEHASARLPGTASLLDAMSSLALVRQRLHGPEASEAMTRETLALSVELVGPEHPDTLTTRNNLGLLLNDAGRLDEAEAIFRDVLEIRVRTLGPLHSHTLVSRGMLARTLGGLGRFAEAEPLALEAYEGFVAALGPGHRYTRFTANVLGRLYEQAGDDARAAHWRGVAEAEDGGG